MWKAGLEKYDEVQGIDWGWLCSVVLLRKTRLRRPDFLPVHGDSCSTKAPLAQESVGKNPTDRGKNGGKTSLAHRRQRRSVSHSDIANQLKNRLLPSPETCLKPHDFGLGTSRF